MKQASCSGCPYNDGLIEEATYAQNMGCLPTAAECTAGLANGKIWMCHANEKRVCGGIARQKPDMVEKERVLYSEWYLGKSTLNA